MEKQFTINVHESALDDLKQRLKATRWTDEVEDSKWKFGTNLGYLKSLCDYWSKDFDWKKQETYLNSFPNYKTVIDGIGLHYLHQRGAGQHSTPLLLIHGWPDSFVRFLKVIPLLTAADEEGHSFDVIIPSIPGHGFSDIPPTTGMNNQSIATRFVHLMTKALGYEKFLVHGGDAGSEIAEQIALYHPNTLVGLHLTDIPYHHIIAADDSKLSSEEKEYKKEVNTWQQTEGAYNMIQSTRPQTLSIGLNDSPAGLAAWILEKFYKWSDSHGDLENCFTKDELLTNITIYWVTQTIHASFRRYHETMNDVAKEMFNPLQKLNPFDKTGTKSMVPTGVAQFKTDLLPPRQFADQFFNIIHWSKMPKGGHFAAMEQPEIFAQEIRNFTRELGLKRR